MLQERVDQGVLADQHFGRGLSAGAFSLFAQGGGVATNARLQLQLNLAPQQIDQRLGEFFLLGGTAKVLTLDPQAPQRAPRRIFCCHALGLQSKLAHQGCDETTLGQSLDDIGPTVTQLGASHHGDCTRMDDIDSATDSAERRWRQLVPMGERLLGALLAPRRHIACTGVSVAPSGKQGVGITLG
jgi:hypothetical protein